MRATNRRGFVLVYVLFVAAILAVLIAVLISGAQRAASDTQFAAAKDSSFDAAEAGLNVALDALDTSLLNIGNRSGTLSTGYKYQYTVYPNFLGSLTKLLTEPVFGQGQVSIPIGSAVIVSVGSGPNGERPTTVEAVVTADITTMSFQKYAVLTGRNVQGNYTASGGISDASGTNSANIHANESINARVSGGLQGSATSSGNTNTLPPRTTGTTPINLPTVSQFDYMVANYLNQAKLFPGPTNVYKAAGSSLSSSYVCPTGLLLNSCLLFYDGPLDMGEQEVVFTGPWTAVVNGDFQQSRGGMLQFTNPGLLVVNGNAGIEGDGVAHAYIMSKGNTDLGSNAALTGAILTLGNLSFQGGGGGSFRYDSSVVPPPKTIVGLVKIVTFGEF